MSPPKFSSASDAASVLDPLSYPENIESAVVLLAATGAIARIDGVPLLIGDLQWIDDRELLLFPAFGDSPGDVRRLRFDEAAFDETGNVTFSRDHRMIGRICRIGDSGVDDPDDYRIAWQLWQEVAPLRSAFIQRSYEAVRLAG